MHLIIPGSYFRGEPRGATGQKPVSCNQDDGSRKLMKLEDSVFIFVVKLLKQWPTKVWDFFFSIRGHTLSQQLANNKQLDT